MTFSRIKALAVNPGKGPLSAFWQNAPREVGEAVGHEKMML
jgi:hypothetical protein